MEKGSEQYLAYRGLALEIILDSERNDERIFFYNLQ